MQFRPRPQYLQPVRSPLHLDRASQCLRSLHQSTAQLHRMLQDVEKELKRFEAFPQEQQTAAAEVFGLPLPKLLKAAHDLVDATPKDSDPAEPQRAVSPSKLRKQK